MAQDGDEEVSSRSAVHAAVARGHAAAPVAGRRRQAGAARRSIRRPAICSCARRIRSAATAWRRTTAPIRWSMPDYSNMFARGAEEMTPARHPAQLAAVRRADGHRSQQRRDRVEDAARRGQCRAAQQSAAQGRDAARSSRIAEQPAAERWSPRAGSSSSAAATRYLYAFDKKTGKEIWRGKVPYANNANPMTYRTKSGRQFIVMATGTGADNALVAFALGGNNPGTP